MVTTQQGAMVVALALLVLACAGDSGDVPSVGDASHDSQGASSCPVFPANNPWNRSVSGDPVDSRSAAYIASIDSGRRFLHADFGSNSDYGIPWTTVPGDQPRVPMTFDYDDESDPGPYPIPEDAPVEAGSDRHVIVIDRDACMLYETWSSRYVGPGWHCGSGAIFNLRSNDLRPAGWTSADAAGLPIFPGLARLDEVRSGRIRHALRFTASRTQRAYVSPARHFASSRRDSNLPPMGLRVRLKAGYDIGRFTGDARVILECLRTYGMILADNGGDWFISGETNTGWDDEDLDQLKTVPGSAFEAIETGPLTRN